MGVYLDNAASTKVKQNVLQRFVEVAEKQYGNPSSEHKEGMNAKNIIEETKDIISKKIHCERNEIFFYKWRDNV